MKSFLLFLIVATVLSNGNAYSQSCSGEVMHFRETFGNGTGSAPLAAGRTNYTYNGSTSLQDGQYKLGPSTQGRPEWYNVADHTGDVNGRMMITNASYTAGEFYRDTVFGLTSTKTYSVYFYAMNVNTVGTCSPNPILPVLEIVVESYNNDGTFTLLSSVVSDSLRQTNPATWVRISGTYYLPTNTTAIRYRIINKSTGGCGNDLAIDDITFSQCQPVVLPISGLALKGKKEKGAVKLDWSAKDTYTSFDIEKSEGGNTWSFVKNVKANPSNQYSTDDINKGEVQYRIAAISSSGRRYYSNVISVKEAAALTNELSVYPNPFQTEIKMHLHSADAKPGCTVKMFTATGNLTTSLPWNVREGDNNIVLQSGNVKPGIYFITVADRNGKVLAHERLIKN